jgi:hypothetical protein
VKVWISAKFACVHNLSTAEVLATDFQNLVTCLMRGGKDLTEALRAELGYRLKQRSLLLIADKEVGYHVVKGLIYWTADELFSSR